MLSVLNLAKLLLNSLLIINLIALSNCFKLRGVTVLNYPYVDKYEDNNGDIVYDGYAMDLIDKIAKFSGFDYDLYEAPDGKYGVYDPNTGRIDGMIGELHYNRADFALGDITITDERKRFVDFTVPFMTSTVAAIVHKKYGQHLQTFSDLYYQTNLSYGVISHSATYQYFYHSKDSILSKMFKSMDQKGDSFVRNRNEGIARVNTSAFAFISESASLEFEANINCELMVIYDKNEEFRDSERHYAIALKRGPQYLQYLQGFNLALDNLNKTGELDELKQHYWGSDCPPLPNESDFDINSSHSLNFISMNSYLVFLLIRKFFN